MNQALSFSTENLKLNEKFKSVILRIDEIIKKNGKHATAFHDPNLKVFDGLYLDQKQKVLTDAKVYLDSLEFFDVDAATQTSANITINEDYKLSLWSALKFFGMRPMSDLFGYLAQDKIVEVYNSQGIQIWRNFNFFEVCGYSIEEMFCYTWIERYERNDETISEILAIISRFIDGEMATIKCDIYNQIKELISTQKLTIDANHEYLSPFYDKHNNYAGFIAISSGVISETTNQAADRVVRLPIEISDNNLI